MGNSTSDECSVGYQVASMFRYRRLAPNLSVCNIGCGEAEEARRMQLTTAIRSVGDVNGSCKEPMRR